MKPLAIDLFCGLGWWSEALLAEGWDVVGFDIEAHQYLHPDHGVLKYPATLVLRDVLTIHGAEFRDADLIVASPPCQAYSYRAMPWSRARSLPPPDNSLFDACFRIQREASAAKGQHIPLVVENVRGAQKWVGRARWNFGSYYLWGDVPALMPIVPKAAKNPGFRFGGKDGAPSPSFQTESVKRQVRDEARKNNGGSWFAVAHNTTSGHGKNPVTKATGQDWNRFKKTGAVSPHWRIEGLKTKGHLNQRDGHGHTRHLTNRAEHGVKHSASGRAWLDTGPAALSSKSNKRKMASAMIAKIPPPLALHVARVFKPREFPRISLNVPASGTAEGHPQPCLSARAVPDAPAHRKGR